MDGKDHGRSKRKRVHRCNCRKCRPQGDWEVAENHRSISRVMMELDERSNQLFAEVLARQFGWDGIEDIRKITGLTCVTIRRIFGNVNGTRRSSGPNSTCWRRTKTVQKKDRAQQLLKELLKDSTARDPMGGLRWTRETTRNIATALQDAASASAIRRWQGCCENKSIPCVQSVNDSQAPMIRSQSAVRSAGTSSKSLSTIKLAGNQH